MAVRADPRRRRYAEVEAAVARFAPALHARLLTWQRRFLRRLLRRLRRLLPVDARRAVLMRADLEGEEVAALYRRELEDAIHEALAELRADLDEIGRWPELRDLAAAAAFSAGWLPRDPYATEVLRETFALVERGVLLAAANRIRPGALATAIIEARGDAVSPRDLERRIIERWGVTVPAAERIVRTVYTAGSGAASLRRIVEAGYRYKRWVATRDDRVRGRRRTDRHDHLHMDGQTVPVEEPFRDPRSGDLLMYPGDTSLGAGPGAVVNCRCTVVGAGRPSRRPAAGRRPSTPARPFGGRAREQVPDALQRIWQSLADVADDVERARRFARAVAPGVDRAVSRTRLHEHVRIRVAAGVDREAAEARLRAAVEALRAVVGEDLDVLLARRPPTVSVRARPIRAQYDLTKNAVRVWAGDTVDVWVHELGHWLEHADPELGRLARTRYLRPRIRRERPVPLRFLIPGSRYPLSEVAWVGDWPHPYMGKIYDSGATEVVSMILEALVGRRLPEVVADRGTLEWLAEAMEEVFGSGR